MLPFAQEMLRAQSLHCRLKCLNFRQKSSDRGCMYIFKSPNVLSDTARVGNTRINLQRFYESLFCIIKIADPTSFFMFECVLRALFAF